MRIRRLSFPFLATILQLAGGPCAFGQNQDPMPAQNLAAARQILEMPADRLDLARAKLTIDKMMDPTINVDEELHRLDRMVEAVKSIIPAGAIDLQQLAALRLYLHKPGEWNDHRPFGYDFEDPLGKTVERKLLPTYIETRRGNCVSMPLLFVILGQQLGLNITATTAPRHVLAKYRLPTGDWINVEATSGGAFARDSWIQGQHAMTQQSLSSGAYLKPLTKHETVVVMLSTVLEYYAHKGRYEAKVPLAELALRHWPQSVSAMLHMGTAYGRQLQRDCASKYSTLLDTPKDMRAHCARLIKQTNIWWDKAESVGWREPTPEQEAAYRNRLMGAAEASRGG